MDDRTEGTEGTAHEIAVHDAEVGGARSRWPLALAIGLVVVAVIIVVVADRGGDGDDLGTSADPGEQPPSEVWDRTWVIERIVERGQDRPVVPAGDGPPTLTLTEADGVSFSGCNGGAGPAHLDGDRLVVDDVMSTLMGCEGPEGQALMAQDTWLGEFLMAGPTVAVAGDTLVLATADAEVHLRETAPTADAPGEAEGGFWGSRWKVVEVDPLEPPMPRELADDVGIDRLYLDATVAGQVSFDGCNGGAGDASLEVDVLEVGPMFSTEIACEGPDGEALMAYDRWMTDFLTAGPTVAVDGDDLTLTGADATVRLVRVGDGADPSPGGGLDDGGDPDAPTSNQPGSEPPGSIAPTPPDAPGAGGSPSAPSPGVGPG